MVKRRVPNVVRGGTAIPLKDKTNYYYMAGRKHSNGGIDIGENPRTGLEVEDGEVMHIGKNEIKVFSAQPFLNGKSPAQRVMQGDNPDNVFNAQERFKKRNKLNDDGTKKKQNGGSIKYIFDRVNRKNTPDFIRMRDINRKSIPDWENENNTSTNKVAVGTDTNGQVYLYNDVQDDGRGGLIDMTNPRNFINGRYMGHVRAEERGDTIHINSIEDGLRFSAEYKDYYPGFPKTKRMGGLSRDKDYGSSKKPYPNIKSKDFAGGHRSYPIPTKADAVDALRLAGLHGRDDVKAKVYRKYPELRKKSKAGGLYSVTSNGKTRLYQFPSTGESSARSAEVRIRKVGGGPKGMNPDLYNEKDDYEYNYSLSPAVNEQLRQEHEEVKSRVTIGQNPNPTNAPASSSNNSENKEDNKDNWWRRTTNKIGEYIKDNPSIIPDVMGLTSNTVGGLLSHKWNRDMLNKLKYSDQPIARSATKLKTRININPQLDKMRETLAAYERDIDNNTASSRVALARKQRARLANMLAINELYGNKENIETELINKDKLNQQSVAHANIADYNRWAESRAAFRNAILEKKAENDVALAETLNTGVQDLIGRREKRKFENQTIAAMALANPNLPIEMLYAQDLVNKKTYKAYKKAYRNKKKND